MEVQDYYLVCAVMLMASLALVALMHFRCTRKIAEQKIRNDNLQMAVSEYGLKLSGLKQLLREFNEDDLGYWEQVIQANIQKLDETFANPDNKLNKRDYKIARERWLAILEIFYDELGSRKL